MQGGLPPQKPGGAIRQSHPDTANNHSKGKWKDGVTLTTASMLLGGQKSMQCGRGCGPALWEGLRLKVKRGAAPPCCGRDRNPALWEGLSCHVGGVTPHTMGRSV